MYFKATQSAYTTGQPSKKHRNLVNLLDIFTSKDDDQYYDGQIPTFDQFAQIVNAYDFQKNQLFFIKNTNLKKPRFPNTNKSLKENQVQSQKQIRMQRIESQTYNNSHISQTMNIKLVTGRRGSQQFRFDDGQDNDLHGNGLLSSISERSSRHSRHSTNRDFIINNQNNLNLNAGLDLAYNINTMPHNLIASPQQNMQQELDNGSVKKSSAHSSRSFRGKQLINQYQIKSKLGVGGFSKIYLCQDIHTQKQYAMKVITKLQMRKKLLKKNSTALAQNYINNQIAILKKIDHPYIIKLYEVIEDQAKKKIYIILDYCKGGYINQLKSQEFRYKKLLQSQCKRYYKQLALALDYIHNILKISHRDIKPQNILLSQKDQIKLSDFGLGTDDIGVSSKSGTIGYLPPQTRKIQLKMSGVKITSQMADIWAMGITLLVLLTGKSIQIADQNIQQYVNNLKDISKQCKDFLLKCLKINPQQRITAVEILDHPWIQVKKQTNYSQIVVSKQEQQSAIITINRHILSQISKMFMK